MRARLATAVALSAAFLVAAALVPAPALARRALRVRFVDRSASAVLRSGKLRLTISGGPRQRVRLATRIQGGRHGRRLRTLRLRLGAHGRRTLRIRTTAGARRTLRAETARCRATAVAATLSAGRRHVRAKRRLGGGHGCRAPGHPIVAPGQGPPAGSGKSALFSVGAATADFTPPRRGAIAGDASDCDPSGGVVYSGRRDWAFMEPYVDVKASGHFDQGDPYLDCNHNGRWDGNFIGGGSGAPRFFTRSADPVTSRALVVGNGTGRIAVEVTDQEGLFNVYQQQIRDKVNADLAARGEPPIGNIFISATHDESAPDTLGISGVDSTTSSVNDYFLSYFVDKSAQAIEDASAAQRPAHIRFAETLEPANMRQCWSSYPYVDDQVMPAMQAVGLDGKPIATLASVSQHAETLGFNPSAAEKTWLSADWPNFFRRSLEQRFGGVAIEMAGSVGSVESPQVFPSALSRTPQRFQDGNQPAGCRTLFDAAGSHAALGYDGETRSFGEQLAGAVGDALRGDAFDSASNELWGERRDVCVELSNGLFAAGAAAGVFAHRPAYGPGCTVEVPPSPTGQVAGKYLKSQVAAFRIGDGEFISLPGEVFPFTYLRGFLGPQDMNDPSQPLPGWPLPHMNAPWRFFDGLGEDMIGYVFPRGNSAGVPGEDPSNPDPSGDDRFGCHHSDDSEAASSQSADVLAPPLIGELDGHGRAETVTTGRYVLPDGSVSRDPLGGPGELKCSSDQTFHPDGPAVAVDLPAARIVHPAAWLSLSGRPQRVPDRNTRGYFAPGGKRVWLDVYPDVTVP